MSDRQRELRKRGGQGKNDADAKLDAELLQSISFDQDTGLAVPETALYMVYLTVFIDSLAATISTPALPYYARRFNAGNEQIGYLFAAWSFTSTFCVCTPGACVLCGHVTCVICRDVWGVKKSTCAVMRVHFLPMLYFSVEWRGRGPIVVVSIHRYWCPVIGNHPPAPLEPHTHTQAPFLGRVSDIIGRRRILMLSLVGAGTAAILQGTATSYYTLLFARAFSGVWAAVGSSASVYLADVCSPASLPEVRACECCSHMWMPVRTTCATHAVTCARIALVRSPPHAAHVLFPLCDGHTHTQYMARLSAVPGAAMIFGPGLGGGLSKFGLNVPILVDGVCSFIAFLLCYFYLPESPVWQSRSDYKKKITAAGASPGDSAAATLRHGGSSSSSSGGGEIGRAHV